MTTGEAGHPLSFAQEELWLADQLREGRATEHLLSGVFRLRGALDEAALAAALTATATRHEVLRTRYATVGGAVSQVVDDPSPVRLVTVDLTDVPVAERERHAREVAAADQQVPIDLRTQAPWRVTLIRFAPDDAALFVTVHHIAFDGWSWGVLTRELSAHYGAALAGEVAALPELRLQYRDHAERQRQRNSSPLFDRQLAYWRERLAGLEPLDLPTDRPRPARWQADGDDVTVTVSAELAAALARIGRSNRATPFMTYLAAFQVLLARHTGRTDIAVGTSVAGRDEPGLDQLIGPLLHTVVLRTDLSGDPSFTEALARARNASVESFANRDVPFPRVAAAVDQQRDLSRNPVFQVAFVLQSAPREPLRLQGLDIELLRSPRTSASFDLSLHLFPDADGSLRAYFLYPTALFDRASVERLAEGYLTLLDSIVAGPDTHVSRLAVLPEGERRRLAGWNDTGASLPAALVPSLFAAQVAATPDAVAVMSGADELSYARLGDQVARLADHLRAAGVGPETRVGVALPRGAELATALLGVLTAGGVYLPLPPEYPAERLGWIVADARPALILTLASLRETVTGFAGSVPVVTVDAQEAEIAAATPADRPVLTGDAAAYVIYTSGSTGRPKGVVVTHAGIANRVAWSVDRFGMSTGDRVLQKTTIGFDASLWEFLAPLTCGAAVVMAGPDAHRDPAVMLREVSDNSVTVLQLVPSVLRLVLDEPGLAACTSLRLVCSAGEALPMTLAGRLLEILDVELVNTYGPTEAAIDATAHAIEARETLETTATAPIGRPLPNLRAFIVDAADQLVPVGVTGELRLAGIGLARGYHDRPDLTAERFTPNPYATAPGERWYHTGDLARRRDDGSIEFRGRLDHQVKIHGVRVEPGEIEAALRAHPAVATAVVATHQSPTGDTELTGYLVPTDTTTEAAIDVAAIREHLTTVLPAAMVPATLLVLDTLPLLANGKLDRTALPTPDASERVTTSGYLAPRTPTEQAIADALADLLGLDRVGVHDDFFVLGGHSLLVIRLMLKLRRAFEVDLTVDALFGARTVARLAALVEENARDDTDDGHRADSGIVPVPRDGVLPLSFAQRRLWFLDQLDPGSVEYLIPVALRLRGRLDVAALRRAVDEVAAGHEVLRTRYADNAGDPVQIIDPLAPVPFTVADLRGDPDPDAAGRALLDRECGRPFDLARDHPLRVTVVRTGDAEHLLAITAHHIAFDGWSTSLFLRDLDTAYRAAAAGRPGPLRPAAVQYADFAVWEHGPDAERARAGHLSYWRERLAGLEPLELPTDRPRPARRDPRGDAVVVPVPDELARAVVDLAARHGATTYMTLLAAFNVLLARHSGRTDIAVGTPVAGRTRPETEHLLGFFVNSLVIRTDLTGQPTFTDYLDQVRRSTLDALAHQDLPFEHLVEALRPDRDLSRNPLFQVMFDHKHHDGGPLTVGDATGERLNAGVPVAKFDLCLTTFQHADGRLRCVLDYATELFDRVTVERLARHYVELLASIVTDPRARLGELSLLPDGERRDVLGGWAAPAVGRLELLDPPGQRRLCVPELFERRVEQAPDAVAVLAGGQRMSYGELNAAANRLARHLRSLGVGPEVVVGCCLERSPEAVVVLLGVLKAGGVYAPFDPRHPAERLERMLTDAGAAVVVTSRAFAGRLGVGHQVVTVDGDAELIARHQPANLAPSAGPGNLAYVIYTSGSTGRPKGVMIEHRAYAHHCRVIADAYGIGPDDRVVLLSALTFDVAMDQIAATLLAGAAIVVSDPVFWTPTELPARLAEHGVTVMEITPAYYRELLAADVSLLAGLELMNVGSDVVTVADAQRWAATGLPARFLCNYGPTEATVTCLLHPVDGDLAGQRPEAALPIGRPVAGTTAYVLDAGLRPVPVGAPGELCLGGPRLARGYHARPALTAERFVPDPYATTPGARLYRTGDLVRHRADGTIEFLGRIDQQVKIRGFRIELGEIEAALLQHPTVHAAAVIAREDQPGDRRLVAYVVPKAGTPLDVTGLRAHLRDLLPDYMIPSYWVAMDALPLTTSKKVDRNALPAPDVSLADTGTDYQAPDDPVEQTIADIWSGVLGIARIGAHDDFFQLGGHSLLATRVLARLHDTFAINLPLRTLFEATTVQALAAAVVSAIESDIAALSDAEVEELLSGTV